MKKLLTCLLTLSMVLTIGATNVFAEGSQTITSTPVDGNSTETWNGTNVQTQSQEIDVNVEVNETGTPPTTHNDYFRPGGTADNPNAKKVYCVDITWTEVNGVFSKAAEYEWNPDTLSYVAKGGTGTGELTKVSDPKLTVNIRNRSNKPVWYKTQGGRPIDTMYVTDDVISSLTTSFSNHMLAAPDPGTNIDDYGYTTILDAKEFTLIPSTHGMYSKLIEALENLESDASLKVAYFKVTVSTTDDGNPNG